MLHSEFVEIVKTLAGKLEPASLGTVIAALAPLVTAEPVPFLTPAAPAPASVKPKPQRSRGPGRAGERARELLKANPDMGPKELAAAAGVSIGTALRARQAAFEPAAASAPMADNPITHNDSRPAPPQERARARQLLRDRLAKGPKRREDVQGEAGAACISEAALIAAAEDLGVVTRNGEWRLPGDA